jgi:hypothetical protein
VRPTNRKTNKTMTDAKKTSKGWTGMMAIGLGLLASCGGGGGAATPTNEAASQSPSTQWTYPSGYVHMVGHWASKDVAVSPYPSLQSSTKSLIKGCNAMRALVGAPDQAEPSDEKWKQWLRVDTWYYYEQASSAARTEIHGPTSVRLPDLERFNRDLKAANGFNGVAPPDCTQYLEGLHRSALIWTADSKRYDVSFNSQGQATQVGFVNVAAQPRSTAPAAGTVPVEVNIGGSIEKCYPWWSDVAMTQPANPTYCMWDRYANVIFRNLPMPLKFQLELGTDRLVNEAVEVSPMIPAAAGPWGPEPFDQIPTVQAQP